MVVVQMKKRGSTRSTKELVSLAIANDVRNLQDIQIEKCNIRFSKSLRLNNKLP